MRKKEVYVLYYTRQRTYFAGLHYELPIWAQKINDSYWFPTKEKALSAIKQYELYQCEIQEKIAIYPDREEPYIE